MFIEPTYITVLRSLCEYRESEEAAALKAALGGFSQAATYIKINGDVYPLKRIWARAYEPRLAESAVTLEEAQRGLAKLGFTDILDVVEVAAYLGRKALRRPDGVEVSYDQHSSDGPSANVRDMP